MYNPSGKYQEDVRYENGKALGYEREDMDEDKNVNKYEHEHKHGEGNETKSKDEDEEHFGFYGDQNICDVIDALSEYMRVCKDFKKHETKLKQRSYQLGLILSKLFGENTIHIQIIVHSLAYSTKLNFYLVFNKYEAQTDRLYNYKPL